MSDVSRIREAIDEGARRSSEDLLPLVYDQLRRLASRQMLRESPDNTLQPTALVHEVYLRLVDAQRAGSFTSREQFFAAAAEAMRRILIERARQRKRLKRGGGRQRIDLDAADVTATAGLDDLLAIDEALGRLQREDALAERLVRLHWYGGLPIEEAAAVLGMSRSLAYEVWRFARAWLRVALE